MGINVAENEPLVAFSHENDAIAVQTTKRNLTTQILVGADGAHSIVRRELSKGMGKAGQPKTTCSTLCLIKQVEESNSPEHRHLEAVIDFSSTFRREIRGYVWSFPLISQGKTWLNVGVGGFHISKGSEYSLQQTLLEFLAERGVSLEKSRLEAHPIRWFHPESVLSTNRVLLVGDAAGIDPLWGEGISFSLGYGAVAADCIAGALKSKDLSFASYKEELLKHEIGHELMNRFELANKLYRSEIRGSLRAHLLSVLLPT
jgi:flavin-dependent dehydrogenase